MEGQNKGNASTNGLIDSWVPRNFCFLSLILCYQGVQRCSMYWKQLPPYAKAQGPELSGAPPTPEAKWGPPTDNAEP